uniref:Ovule protein n=1 Tax=Angiostrongylus cantonensis TaxID=6313 RepID=A0A0K0DJ23_ANGCA
LLQTDPSQDVNREESSRQRLIVVGARPSQFYQPEQFKWSQPQVISATKEKPALRQRRPERQSWMRSELQSSKVGGDESERASGMLPAFQMSFFSGSTEEGKLLDGK